MLHSCLQWHKLPSCMEQIPFPWANMVSTMLNCCLADLLNYPLYRRRYIDQYHHSQDPTTPYGTAASPASFCDCSLVYTWSTWSWIWLAIVGLTLSAEMAKGAGYGASITTSHRDLSWHPYYSKLHLRPANHHLQKVCVWWRPSNHAYWWGLAGSGKGWWLRTWQLHVNTSKLGS